MVLLLRCVLVGALRTPIGLVNVPIAGDFTSAPPPLLARTQPIVSDGCQNRFQGVWCEDGHVVGWDFFNSGWRGALTAQIADLTHLKWLHFNDAQLKVRMTDPSAHALDASRRSIAKSQ